MQSITRRKWLAAAGGIAAAAGTQSVFAEDQRADNSKKQPAESSRYKFKKTSPRELIRQRHLPNVQLITQDGKKVRFYDDLIKDKKFVLNFFFTECVKACPIITSNLAQVQKMLRDRIGHDIFMYSITLNPEHDTPKVLKEYAKMHRAGPGWLFLAAKPADTLLLRKRLGYFYDNPAEDADLENHIGMLQIGDEAVMRWSHCEGQARPQYIAKFILNEADDSYKGAVRGIRLTDPSVKKRRGG